MLPLHLFAQQCTAGTGVTGSAAIIGNNCSPVTLPVGTAIIMKGLSSAMTTQTLCAASQCPSGLYLIHGYVVVTQAATLGSVQAVIQFTDDGGSRSMNIGPNLSLTSATAIGFSQVVETTGSTGITMTTTAASLTGTPLYNVYASVIKLKGF